jgi:SWIM zinc finger
MRIREVQLALPTVGRSQEGPAECRLEVAALMERRTGVSGIGWRLRTPDSAGPVRAETRRYGQTLLSSELTAVRRGLLEATRARCRHLVLLVADPRAIALIRGGVSPRFRRAAAAAELLRPLLEEIPSVRFESSFAPDPELAHAVGEALDAGLHSAADREEHRALVMERIVARAREVRLERADTGWVANERYRVQLDPMRCECPAWTARWAGAPIAGRRAQRLPCKHIVALALHEGITVPADLAQMARRAPA